MKVFKSILLYLLIAIGLCAAAVLVCCVILMLSPSTKIFGYQYISYKKSYSREISDYNSLNTQAISITSNRMKIQIIPNTSDDLIRIEYNPGMSGFVKSDKSKLELKVEVKQDQQFVAVNDGNSYDTLNIDMIEPDGLIFLSSSVIKVYVPVSRTYAVIYAENGKGGIDYVSTDSSKQVKVNNLYLKTTNSDIEIVAPNASTYNFTTTTGDLKINNNNNDINANITFNTSTGSFQTTSTINGTLNVNSTARSVGPNISVKKVLGTFNYNAPAGNVNIEEIGSQESGKGANLAIKAINGSFNIGKIYGYTYVQPYDEGNIKNLNFNITSLFNIDTENRQSFFESGEGNINIGTLKGYAQFKTSTGNVTIKDAYESMFIYSYSGAINVTYNTSSRPNESLGGFQVNTTESNVTATNLHTKVEVVVNSGKFTRSRTINLTFDKVASNCTIDAYTHDVILKTKIGCSYTLVAGVAESKITINDTVGTLSKIASSDSDYKAEFDGKNAYRIGYIKDGTPLGKISVITEDALKVQGY